MICWAGRGGGAVGEEDDPAGVLVRRGQLSVVRHLTTLATRVTVWSRRLRRPSGLAGVAHPGADRATVAAVR